MDKQRAALEHALTALSDGSGHEVWGPGVVGYKLYTNGHQQAANAFDTAAASIYKLMLNTNVATGAIPRNTRERFIVAMRLIAPVMYDAMLVPDDPRLGQ